MIFQNKIDKKVKCKILKNKYSSRIYLTLWCVLWSLTIAHRTQPPTIHKVELVHRISYGNEVPFIWEWYFCIDKNECNSYPFLAFFNNYPFIRTYNYIMDKIVEDVLILYQNFFSPQVKQSMIINNKHGIYELPHELPNDLRLRILGN